jgi:hypothetical protein
MPRRDRILLLGAALLACGPLPGTARDACAGMTCSGHGGCATIGGIASCRCDLGYTAAPSDPLSCVPDRNATGCGGGCCVGGQQSYCSQAPCGTTADKRDCCIVVGGDWVCVN